MVASTSKLFVFKINNEILSFATFFVDLWLVAYDRQKKGLNVFLIE